MTIYEPIYNPGFLGAKCSEIVEKIAELYQQAEDGIISHSEKTRKAEEIAYKVLPHDALGATIFGGLKAIVTGQFEGLHLSTVGLNLKQFTVSELVDLLKELDVCGFSVGNHIRARDVVALSEYRWQMEGIYSDNEFSGIWFTRR